MTENKKWNVLLIEAGKVETAVQDVPVLAAYMQSTAFNWGFVSEPQAGSCSGKLKKINRLINQFRNRYCSLKKYKLYQVWMKIDVDFQEERL